MSKPNPAPRRTRVERNIYKRADGKYEIGFKDGAGVQRWRTVQGGIMAARALRDELLAARGRGERVAPNPRLRFGDAADKWLAGEVLDLRPTTQAAYRNSVKKHLRPRYATRRLDTIAADDVAALVRDLRAEGQAESHNAAIIATLGRIYKYAARRLGWAGQNPVELLLRSERPKLGHDQKHVFEGQQIEQTIAAASEPWHTLFTVAALTGARMSEIIGLTWANVKLDDPDDAEISYVQQVDRHGNAVPLKTESSRRAVPIAHGLAVILTAHKLRSARSGDADYVFATSTGRPQNQRNVQRALLAAERKAVTSDGSPTFPVLHERDKYGKLVKVPRGSLPSMHSFRHTYASRAVLTGESIDEIAFDLGHRSANVTRAVYVHEIADARRKAARRDRMAAEYGSVMEAASGPIRSQKAADNLANVRHLRGLS
jgi:integrase